jgi:hypothetical protein
MPLETRWYRVRETREVKVEAQDPLSAAHIAQLVFDGRDNEVLVDDKPVGKTTLRTTNLEVSEDY